MKHIYQSEIIKACDIRGVYGTEITHTDGYHFGLAFGTILIRDGRKSCVLGYDGRVSSPELAKEVIRGISETGIDTISIGLVPTPAVYFAVHHLEVDAGVMVTASHNPAEYNGIKFVLDDDLFHGASLKGLETISRDGDYERIETVGGILEEDIRHEYTDYLQSFLNIGKESELKIIWDSGNGAAGEILEIFTKQIPGIHTVIFSEIDGNFPNHHPDPSNPKNMKMLRDEVLRTGSDLGIAFDGDADRMGAVDSTGRILTGDQLLAVFSRDYLKKNPGAAVISEVKASTFLYRDIEQHGGIPRMWKVGHANQKEKMKEEKIGFGGETSGHIFFEENNGYDDGLFSAVKLINVLYDTDKTLAEIVDTFPKIHHTGEIRIELPTKERYQLIADIEGRLKEAGRDFIDIDGVRVPINTGFWIMRCSNTQPHITIYCESETEEGLIECKHEMISQIEASGYIYEHLLV